MTPEPDHGRKSAPAVCYADLMTAALNRLGAPLDMQVEHRSAVDHFAGAYLFPCAHSAIAREIEGSDDLLAAVRTRYPRFHSGARESAPSPGVTEALSMALFASFALERVDDFPDLRMRVAAYRAIIWEIATLLDHTPDAQGKPGLVRIGPFANCLVRRKGLASGIDWLDDEITRLEGCIARTRH